jgi:hypothetical protein
MINLSKYLFILLIILLVGCSDNPYYSCKYECRDLNNYSYSDPCKPCIINPFVNDYKCIEYLSCEKEFNLTKKNIDKKCFDLCRGKTD